MINAITHNSNGISHSTAKQLNRLQETKYNPLSQPTNDRQAKESNKPNNMHTLTQTIASDTAIAMLQTQEVGDTSTDATDTEDAYGKAQTLGYKSQTLIQAIQSGNNDASKTAFDGLAEQFPNIKKASTHAHSSHNGKSSENSILQALRDIGSALSSDSIDEAKSILSKLLEKHPKIYSSAATNTASSSTDISNNVATNDTSSTSSNIEAGTISNTATDTRTETDLETTSSTSNA